jgi:hypothetical protein
LSEILSEQQAQEALFTAMQEDGNRSSYGESGPGAQEPRIPAENSEVESTQTAPAETTPEEQTPAEGVTETTTVEDAFTRLDPNTIPEELKPWYQSMQADYTRKTQAIAEQRKQLETLGDVDQAQAALKFYQSLQDPTFAKNFYTELGGTLTNLGYLEQQQAQELQAAAVAAPTYEDPEAFFAAKAAELDQKYAAIEQRLTEQQQQAEQAQVYAALAGEIVRQDAYLRDANPHYTDSDMEAIYKLAPGVDNNLIEAAQVYENAVADRLNRMMQAKTTVATTHGSTVSTGGAPEPTSFGDDLNAAHAAAQEKLRQILAEN